MWIDIVIFPSSYGCPFTSVLGIWKVVGALSRMLWILILMLSFSNQGRQKL